MSLIRYKAIKSDGMVYRGLTNLKTSTEIRSYVKDEGGKLISWKEEKPKKFKYNLKLQDSINMFTHLATMAKLKIPLIESIHMLDHGANSKELIEFSKSLSFCINRGSSFSEALINNFKNVDPIIISTISAAEKSGSFEKAFRNLIDYYTWRKSYKIKIQNAIRYPFLCFLVVLSTLIFLMTFLVPKMKPLILENSEYNLNFSTKSIFYLHDIFSGGTTQTYFTFLAFTIFSFITLPYILKKILKLQYDIFYKIPFIKNIFILIFQENFLKILYLQLKANKNLQDALLDAKETLPKGYPKKQVIKILDGLDKGYPLSHIFQKIKFDPVVSQLIYLGEAAGSYEKAFEDASTVLAEKTSLFFERITTYLQPLLILFISFILIWMVYALFYPLYENIISMNI